MNISDFKAKKNKLPQQKKLGLLEKIEIGKFGCLLY